MKRLLLIAVFFIIAAGVSAQNYRDKQFSLIDYDLKITNSFREDIQHLEPLLETFEVHNKEADDRLKALLIHHLYYNMVPLLERKLEISILPINSFMQRIKYDEFGYPKASISKALRKGDSPFYFKVRIILDSQTAEEREQNPDLPDHITFPHYTIDITVYNDEGIIPVDRWHGESAADQALQADKNLFGDFIDSQKPGSSSTQKDLSVLHRQAVMQTINSLLDE